MLRFFLLSSFVALTTAFPQTIRAQDSQEYQFFAEIEVSADLTEVLSGILSGSAQGDQYERDSKQIFANLDNISANLQGLFRGVSSIEKRILYAVKEQPLVLASRDSYALSELASGYFHDEVISDCASVTHQSLNDLLLRLETNIFDVEITAGFIGDSARKAVLLHSATNTMLLIDAVERQCSPFSNTSDKSAFEAKIDRLSGRIQGQADDLLLSSDSLQDLEELELPQAIARQLNVMERQSSGEAYIPYCVRLTDEYKGSSKPLGMGAADCEATTVIAGRHSKNGLGLFYKKYRCDVTEYSGYYLLLQYSAGSETKTMSVTPPQQLSIDGSPLNWSGKAGCITVQGGLGGTLAYLSKLKGEAEADYAKMNKFIQNEMLRASAAAATKISQETNRLLAALKARS